MAVGKLTELRNLDSVAVPKSSQQTIFSLQSQVNDGMASRIGRYGDLLQRGFVLGLLGLGGGAIALGVQTHREKLRRGQGASS